MTGGVDIGKIKAITHTYEMNDRGGRRGNRGDVIRGRIVRGRFILFRGRFVLHSGRFDRGRFVRGRFIRLPSFIETLRPWQIIFFLFTHLSRPGRKFFDPFVLDRTTGQTL